MHVLAFHLPQFHPIPENDTWWGTGFTEWTNVCRARPLFPGHYQPHLPADLGFYDLRLPEVRQAQSELAAGHGVTGFCYYHYWFNGRRVLERPVAEMLASGRPDFPFCLCWANEDWTRAWDGRSGEKLLEQRYSDADDQAHIAALLPMFEDPRYIRVAGRPLFLVYRTELMPNPRRTAECWRTAARRAGVGELLLARVESFDGSIDPSSIGFDAAVEFAPDWSLLPTVKIGALNRARAKIGLYPKALIDHQTARYPELARAMLQKQDPGYRRYRCATPGFDNTPRRNSGGVILLDSTPEAYGEWLTEIAAAEQRLACPDDQKIVFINAWNEWAEGNHLEPDQRWGRAYLEATRAALTGAADA